MIIFLLEHGSGLIVSICFNYVSNDWHWIITSSCVLAVLGSIVLLFLPESPKYLVSTGQIQKAHQAYLFIAWVNGVADPEGKVTVEQIRALVNQNKDDRFRQRVTVFGANSDE